MDVDLGSADDNGGPPPNPQRQRPVEQEPTDRNALTSDSDSGDSDGSSYYESETESELSYSDAVYYPDELDAIQNEMDEQCILAMEAPQEFDVPARRAAAAMKLAVKGGRPAPDLTCSLPRPEATYGPYRIFFDMEINGNFAGRVIIKLAQEFPMCRDHIEDLCSGDMAQRGSVKMRYAGTKFHRGVDGEFVEGGILRPLLPTNYEMLYDADLLVRNAQFYNAYTLVVKQDTDDETYGARFFITTSDRVAHNNPDLVPVGSVVFGMNIIDMIASCPKTEDGLFTYAITIGNCGSIHMHERVGPTRTKKKRPLSTFMTKVMARKEHPSIQPAVELLPYSDDEDDEEYMDTGYEKKPSEPDWPSHLKKVAKYFDGPNRAM